MSTYDPDLGAIELTEFHCSSCRNNEWTLYLRPGETGGTVLVVCCANSSCNQEKKEELGGGADHLVVWAEFDITGQGYDMPTEPDSSSVN